MHWFTHLCEQANDNSGLLAWLRDLNKVGYSIPHPTRHDVVILGPEGDDVVATVEGLETKILRGEAVTFNLWVDEWAAIVCDMYSLDPQLHVIDWSCWSLTKDQALKACNLVRDRCRSSAVAGRLKLFVVDETTLTREFNWDDFVRGNAVPEAMPVEVWLEAEREALLKPIAHGWQQERVNGYLRLTLSDEP